MSVETSTPEHSNRSASEAGILGILIWLPNFAGPRLQMVDVEFEDPRHRIILETIRTLRTEGKTADLAGALEWLAARNQLDAAGGREYLVQLVDTACMNGAYRFSEYVEGLKRRSLVSGQSSLGVCEQFAPVNSNPYPVSGEPPGLQEQTAAASTGDETLAAVDQSSWSVAEQCSAPENALPESNTQGSSGAKLLDDLRQLFERHVILPPHAAKVLALWTLHTCAWRLRNVTTYLGIVSPVKRCGKTTLLTLLNKLAHKPEFASNVSPPSIFRVIEETQPTLLIDEGDTFIGAKDELRGILNAGYTRDSAYVLRATGEGQTLRRYSCWCPKVIATIGNLPETLADRCVIIRMRRKTPLEKCERLRNFEGEELRERCQRWVEENSQTIERLAPAIPEALNDRAADIWEPLIVLAELAGGKWPEAARAAAIALNAASAEQDFTSRLLGDIRAIFCVHETDKLFSRNLVEALNSMVERPWREARRGGPINELWLAQQLGAFGIQSRTMRIGDPVGRGYYLQDFTDAFGRYLPKAA